MALADFLNLRRGKQQAQAALRQAAERLPYSTKIPFALAALYESHKDFEEAKNVYQRLAKDYDKKPAGLDAQVKLAQLDFNAGRQTEAEQRLSDVLRQNPRAAQGLILQGKIALIRRNGKDAVQAFRTVLRDQPELAHVQHLLGQAYLMTGESSLARESFERSVALQPSLVEASLALATMDSRNGRPERARSRLRAILQSHSDHRAAMEVLFGLDLAAGDWNHAASILSRLRQTEGETAATLMAEGKLYEVRKDFAGALAAYERAATMAIDAQEPLVAVVQLDLRQKQPERARRRLEAVITAHPQHPYAHGVMGEVLTLIGKHDQAMPHFREATRINPRWLTPWLNAATLSMVQGQAGSAAKTLREGLTANPASEELHMLMASVLASQNAVDEAIAAYDVVLRMNPRNIFSANNLAALLADHKSDAPNLERAFLLSRDFEKEAPHPHFLDTLAWVRLKMGHLEEAVRIMRQAVVKAPDLPTLNYHLGAALYQSGRNGEAKVYLAKALKSAEPFQGRREAQQLLARTNG
ncbi:MAG: tetratricopeptide repeat protein [Nitrospira sp.]